MTATAQADVHTLDEARHLRLISGAGDPDEGTACAITAHHWMRDGTKTDAPKPDESPLLVRWVIAANDHNAATPEGRWALTVAAHRWLPGTVDVPHVVQVWAMSAAWGTTDPCDRMRVVLWLVAMARGADLTGADLTGADLTRADLTYAYELPGTTWPISFDPAGRGVKVLA